MTTLKIKNGDGDPKYLAVDGLGTEASPYYAKSIISDGTDDAQVISTNGNKGLVTISPGHISTDNSTATPLGIGGVYTGTFEETTNFGIIVVTVKSNVESATDGLQVEFSSDGVNLDNVDNYSIQAGVGKTFSFQCAAKYYRVKYTNGAVGQTYFRLQTLLKPYYVKPSSHRINDIIIGDDDSELVKAVLTGLGPDGTFKNVLVTNAGEQKVSIESFDAAVSSNSETQLNTTLYDSQGNRVSIDGLGTLKTYEPSTLVGESFEGAVLDTNFWTATVANGGTVTQSGEILVETNTTANGEASVNSVRKARKIPGTVNQFRAVGHWATATQADNVRTLGVSDLNGSVNGAWFKSNGTTFQIVTSKGGVETAVSSGSFNGDVSTYVLDTNIHRFIIEYSAYIVKFFIDGVLIHKVVSSGASFWTDSLSLGVIITNINSNGNVTDNQMHFQLLTILRLGQLRTATKYRQESSTGTYISKHGAGAVLGIAISDVSQNSVIILYDNTAASGDVIWNSGTLGANALPFNIPLYGLDFFIGLTLSIAGADANVTLTYE